MLRTVLAGVVGVVVAMLTITLCEFAAHAVYPPPPGLDMTDPTAVAAYAATVPVPALVLVLLGWTLGAFDGALAAALVTRSRARTVALVVGAVVVAGVVVNAMLIPHPAWLTALGVVLPLAAAYAAAQLAGRIRRRPVAPASNIR